MARNDANTKISLGEFESLCELEPQARVCMGTFEFSHSFFVFASGYVNTHTPFSISCKNAMIRHIYRVYIAFYTKRLQNQSESALYDKKL